MIKVDGYKAFRGTMKINAKTPSPQGGYELNPFNLYGDWLFKPEAECWYGKVEGRVGVGSYPMEICEVLNDETNFGD